LARFFWSVSPVATARASPDRRGFTRHCLSSYAWQRPPTEERDGAPDRIASGRVLGPEDIQEDSPEPRLPATSPRSLEGRQEQYLASFESSYAQAVLARCGGNVSAAAREAGVDRKTFYTLLKREKEQQNGEPIPQSVPESGE